MTRGKERALQGLGYVTLRHAQSYQFAWVHAIRRVDRALKGGAALDGGADPAAGGVAAAT